jgi:uncharacterized protein YprB with RNaseH-like and TPR domain
MLHHTFCHLPGITESTEWGLWRADVTHWDMALDPSPHRKALLERLSLALLRESVEHYERQNPDWFAQRLPPGQLWRLFRDFRGSCAYLDIETTGFLGRGYVTTVALYDGHSIRHYVRGVNLDQLAADLGAYRLLVTYNGKTFDLPFLQRDLGIQCSHVHIDLRYLLASLGLKGGLKGCERQVGIRREGMEAIDGAVAVLLWQQHQRSGDLRALESLLAYNIQDTLSLERLMVVAYNRKLELLQMPFTAEHVLPAPTSPANPFQVHAATVQQLVSSYPWPRPGQR